MDVPTLCIHEGPRTIAMPDTGDLRARGGGRSCGKNAGRSEDNEQSSHDLSPTNFVGRPLLLNFDGAGERWQACLGAQRSRIARFTGRAHAARLASAAACWPGSAVTEERTLRGSSVVWRPHRVYGIAGCGIKRAKPGTKVRKAATFLHRFRRMRPCFSGLVLPPVAAAGAPVAAAVASGLRALALISRQVSHPT